MALTRAQIQTAFQNSLGRAASANDENSFFSVSQSGALTDAQVFSTISNSQEANLNTDPVVRFYQAAFGRVPDQAGLDNATDYVRSFGASAATYQSLSDMFAASPEFTNRFGTGTAVDAAYVQALYTTILGRQATAGEISSFTSGSNGYTTRGGVLYAISQSQEAISISDTAVNGFLQNAAEGDAVYTGSLYAPANGQPNLPGNAGQTFVLTTAVDVLNGTDNGDVFIGTTGGGQNATLNSGDTISGGGGSDTLRITANGNPNAITPSLTSVENVEVSSFGNATLNLANSTGVTKVSLVNGNGSLFVTGQNALVDLAATGTTGGQLAVQYASAVTSGLNDTQNVSLNNASADLSVGGATSIAVNGVETYAVTATGTNNVQLSTNFGAGETLTKVTVAGAGDLNVTNLFSTKLATFDGSASTGDLTASFTAGGDVAVTGGSGDDRFFLGAGLTTADAVNGGNGFDEVRVTTEGNLSAATAAAPFVGLTSIEKVAFDGNGVTLNGSTFTNTGITNIEFNTTGADVINNAGSARTYEFGADNTGDATFALNATSSSLKLALLGTDGTGAVNDGTNANIDALTISTAGANSTTTAVSVTLDSQGDLADTFFNNSSTNAVNYVATEFNHVGLVTVASGSTITVSGAGNLSVFGGTSDAVTAGFANNVTLDTSAATGNTVLSGSNYTQGSLGLTNTSTTTGTDTFNLGAGKDVIVFGANSSGAVEFATVDGAVAAQTGNILVDTINSFTAGTGGDVLSHDANLSNGINTGAATNYTALTTDTQAAINNLSGAGATLLGAANLAATDASTNWTAFSFQGTTYALFDAAQGGDGAAGYATGVDTLVKLTGVSVASLTDANFAVGVNA